jgi:hypothetical protein
MSKNESEENRKLLTELFGDAGEAMDFYTKIPKITNNTIHPVFQIQQNICRHCKHEEIFNECRHSVKRTVDECGGAFSEISVNDFKIKPSLLELTKLKLEILINSEEE